MILSPASDPGLLLLDLRVRPSLFTSPVAAGPLTVDVTDLEPRHVGAACPCGIERHQQDAMKRRFCRIDEKCYLFWTEYLWQMQHLLRVGRLGDTPLPERLG